MGRYLVEAHLHEGRSVADLAAEHGLHRSWIYKLLARYGDEGEVGLVPRSKRLHRSPGQISDLFEDDDIIRIRKEVLHPGLRRRGRHHPQPPVPAVDEHPVGVHHLAGC